MAAPSTSVFLLLLFIWRIAPALGAVPRFGVVDHATLLGAPAAPAQPASPNPGYVLSGHGLAARQQITSCRPGEHSCVEAGAPGYCCRNDQYCYLDQDWRTRCCALGIQCPGSLCDADTLYCNVTSSATVAVTTASAGQRPGSVVTSVVSRTTAASCCNRACSVSSYSCEATFGGHCCSYGYRCAFTSLCIADPVPSTATSASTSGSGVPPGCAASQVACGADGGRCCDVGSASSAALSVGARVGIGVGVALGAAIAIAAVTWLCIRRRRREAGTTGTNASAHDMRETTAGANSARSQAGTAGAGADPDQGDSLLVGPMTPWTYRSGFSDGSEQEHNYIGPEAIDGPFTDRRADGENGGYDAGLATTPPAAAPLPSDGPGRFFHPDHIMRPVEIGGVEAQKTPDGDAGDGPLASTSEMAGHDEDTTAGRFELVGSPVTPSPLDESTK
ncbi:hypothetical protein F4802DRAFT_505850 [Xylaria palmicola]|nr:hypothetical protein F4802DRAFT_505850 [Xylaria palmicola]